MRKLFIISLVIILQTCSKHPEYKVNTIADGLIMVDGQSIEKAWLYAPPLTSFTNPWNKEVSPETSLSMLKDSTYLYFSFSAKDNKILVDPNFSTERDIEKEDRVELFFSKDREMKEYYCFEMDAKGRTLSYAAKHYRQFNFNWEPPEGFNIAAHIHGAGYAVEGSIPLEFIHKLAGSNVLYFGTYRAEFSKKGAATIENWLTWIDPKTATPDFHVPLTLGELVLSDKK
ncbi:MAG: carbohydrate-binding family 9-like protein [Chitinophagaceae bacterium]|nr:carbohydrate-binding family 9-like protein [Chitinophagaceae bacterium]